MCMSSPLHVSDVTIHRDTSARPAPIQLFVLAFLKKSGDKPITQFLDSVNVPSPPAYRLTDALFLRSLSAVDGVSLPSDVGRNQPTTLAISPRVSEYSKGLRCDP